MKLDVSNSISSCACPEDQDIHATSNFSIADREPLHTQVKINLQATLKMRSKGHTGEQLDVIIFLIDFRSFIAVN